jgi:TolB-like protein
VTREDLRGWLWPDDMFVDFDHGLNAAINKLREVLGDSAEHPRYIETLPRRGYRFIAEVREGPSGPLKRIRSLAVLPLGNLSGDPKQEYFVDGMTEALITNLAKISALRVISRASVMRYKGIRKPLADIAQELNVDGIVEGSVLRVGKHVRISAQLLHAKFDGHLWAESYERDLRDVFALQAEVAQAIAAEIRIQVTPRERKRLRQVRRVDPKAYEAYLLGRFFLNKRTPEGVSKSLAYFQRAIEQDPGYALAYTGLADAYVGHGFAFNDIASPL